MKQDEIWTGGYVSEDVYEISDVTSEAGVIASVMLHPEFTFHSEQLLPNHFTNEQNAYLYYAVRELAKKGIEKIDAYNVTNILSSKTAISDRLDKLLPIHAINEFLDTAQSIARDSPEEYRLVSDAVFGAAFRRETYAKLRECERLCRNSKDDEIEQQIYTVLDNVMMSYSTATEVPQFKDVVDRYWDEIKQRQVSGMSGIPFKFPTLNQYVQIEPGELIVFAAEAKQGKSMMLLNCAVDLLKQGKRVLYIDSELNSRLFTCRILSHLSEIEFARVRSGSYNAEEEKRLDDCRAWLRSQKFTHLYMPMFDAQSIYTTVKKVMHTQGLDVLIVDK